MKLGGRSGIGAVVRPRQSCPVTHWSRWPIYSLGPSRRSFIGEAGGLLPSALPQVRVHLIATSRAAASQSEGHAPREASAPCASDALTRPRLRDRPDISTWGKSGHFYFVLTRWHGGGRARRRIEWRSRDPIYCWTGSPFVKATSGAFRSLTSRDHPAYKAGPWPTRSSSMI